MCKMCSSLSLEELTVGRHLLKFVFLKKKTSPHIRKPKQCRCIEVLPFYYFSPKTLFAVQYVPDPTISSHFYCRRVSERRYDMKGKNHTMAARRC